MALADRWARRIARILPALPPPLPLETRLALGGRERTGPFPPDYSWRAARCSQRLAHCGSPGLGPRESSRSPRRNSSSAATLWWILACAACALMSSASADPGDRPLVAITEMESTVDSGHWKDYKNSKAANFEAMLETQMAKINRFRVMERNRVDQVLGEQARQAALAQNGTILNLAGVDYIVYGAVTKFGQKRQSISTGGFSAVTTTTTFGVDLKVVHVLTGEIKIAESIESTVTSGQGLVTGSFEHSDSSPDPLADVQRAAARKAAMLITSSVFPIRVAEINADEIYLNFGSAMLRRGDVLNIVREGTAFVDPDTGRSLGATRKKVALISVTETTSEFSRAKLLEGSAPKRGDLAEYVASSESKSRATQRRNIGRRL